MDDGCAPVVHIFLGFAPDFLGCEGCAAAGDFYGGGSDAVAGGAVDDVLVDYWAGGGGNGEFEGVIPELCAVFWDDGDETFLSEEDDLAGAADGGGNGGRVGHLIIEFCPFAFPGGFIEGDESLAFAATGEEDEVAFDEW